MTSKIGKASKKNKFNRCKEIKISAQKLIKYKQQKQYRISQFNHLFYEKTDMFINKKRKEIKKENLAEPKKNRKTLQLLTLSSEH